MKLIKARVGEGHLDGGTRRIALDDGRILYIDRRCFSDTYGNIYDKYPDHKDAKIQPFRVMLEDEMKLTYQDVNGNVITVKGSDAIGRMNWVEGEWKFTPHTHLTETGALRWVDNQWKFELHKLNNETLRLN